jgi:23S rRNA (adenine2503-C2)-methyltransferase
MNKNGKINLKDLSLDEIIEVAAESGKKAYSGRQLFKWIFRKGVERFADMTDLSKEFRAKLDDRYIINRLSLTEKAESADGTVKSLWQTEDDLFIESVLIPDDDRLTLCMSSQAGCPLKCSFCATGMHGFKRNLTPGEIYDQYLITKLEMAEDQKITNIVFMGMGEPFLNYRNVLKAADLLTSQLGGGMASRKITISTVGLVDGINKLAEDNPRLNLAISLHSAIEKTRLQLIPIAKKYPLDELKKAARYFAAVSDSRITFEYLLIKDANDSLDDARALAEFVRGIPCKINLITYNSVDGLAFELPEEKTIEAFQEYLLPRTPTVTRRKSKGTDIAAACGQLAGKRIMD